MPLDFDSYLDESERIGENCAVFGIFGPELDVSRMTFFALFSMQHRGQESSGIAVANPEWIVGYKDMGLVSHVFNERQLRILKGVAAIGHNRYSTTGDSKIENAQPVVLDHIPGKHLAIAHNGNLINTRELADVLSSNDIQPDATTDTILMAHLIQESYKDKPIEDALMETLPMFKGAYSLVILTNNDLIAVRDPHGFRPLCMGTRGDNLCFASESAAFPLIGAEFLREVEPGEIIVVNKNGVNHLRLPEEADPKFCMFEFFYFSRPDSQLSGKLLYKVRIKMGRELAKEAPVLADWVIGVPDSGTPAAIGYADASGIKFAEGFVKNRYVGRTFIEPLQAFRDIGVRMKLNPLTEVLEGKRVVLVDDSIVRGSTMRKIVKLLREVGGVSEVHVRLSSSAIRHPCYYGVDFGTRNELIAAHRTEEEICEFIGADSLHYLSIDGMIQSTGLQKEEFCLACFNMEYPLQFSQQLNLHMQDESPKFALESKKHSADQHLLPISLPE